MCMLAQSVQSTATTTTAYIEALCRAFSKHKHPPRPYTFRFLSVFPCRMPLEPRNSFGSSIRAYWVAGHHGPMWVLLSCQKRDEGDDVGLREGTGERDEIRSLSNRE
eukprot:358822-Chlamydomonas_euryale.AAC.2